MSASVNDWQNYVNNYEAKMNALETRLNEKLNDPNVSAEEKTQARADYERQKKYLEWVKQENETIQQTGIVPDSIMVPAMQSGSGAYYWNVDGQWKLFNARLNVPMNGGKITEEYTFIEAEHFNIVWRLYNPPSGIENNYVKHMEASGWPPTTYASAFGLQADFETAPGVWTKYFYWEAIDTKGNLTRQTGSWDYSSSYVWFPCIGVSVTPPQISAGEVCGIGSWNGQSGNSQYRVGSFISISIDGGEAANPWDFYDDNIKPTDPNNAAFPDGWSPAGPYMEWYEVLTYDISCYKDAANETKIKLEFKQPVEKNGNPLKTTTIIFSENENNWTGTVTETPETSEGEIKITPFYLGECLSRRCNNEQ